MGVGPLQKGRECFRPHAEFFREGLRFHGAEFGGVDVGLFFMAL
jgi:hypothetical protein